MVESHEADQKKIKDLEGQNLKLKETSTKQAKEAEAKKDQELKKLHTNVETLTKKTQESEKALQAAQTAQKAQEVESTNHKSNTGLKPRTTGGGEEIEDGSIESDQREGCST